MGQNKLILKYYDQNDNFKDFCPCKTTIEKEISFGQAESYLLVKVDEPFIYGEANNYGNHLLKNEYLLLSLRHTESSFKDSEFHAHVFLVPDLHALERERFHLSKTDSVAWCIVYKL